MTTELEYLEEALEEAEAAVRWYAERSVSAAAAFSEEIDAAESAIVEFPDAWPPFDHGTRRYLLRRYPFSIIYRVESRRILIVASHTVTDDLGTGNPDSRCLANIANGAIAAENVRDARGASRSRSVIMPTVKVVRSTTAVLLAVVCLVAVARTATPAQAQQPTLPPDAPPRAIGAPSTYAPLPPLSADAQALLDRWAQERAGIIDQLRFLQLTYRDTGRAEDAAAIAARVRMLQERITPASGSAAADLVNEGLPNADEPVLISSFRSRVGETLSFAIRGRDDQQIWGTTTYADTSALETAAVHAGLLRPGQRAIVKVRPLPGQDRYDGTNQNGVLSNAYGRQLGSYRFVAASVTTPARTSSLSSYRDLVGHAITLPVVGVAAGSVWGSDVYTDDSSVAAAAVHAGVLSVGEFGFVKITLLPGQTRYDGSAQNGVTSQSYERWDGSFRVERAPEPWIVELPGGEDASRLVPMSTMRGRSGTSFIVQAVGSVTGAVWGTGTYTDDSSIAAAAVHAGLLKPGEFGFVRVTIDGGRDRYAASERNGIKSQSYGPWEGSFRLERVAK